MSPPSVPVDLLNPGQVFACLGLMEMTEILYGPCGVRFNYKADETACRFELDAPDDCITRAVRFLARCAVVAVAPKPNGADDSLSALKWQIETVGNDGQFFPGALPDSPATLPIRLSAAGVQIPVEHWLDGARTGRDNVKFWAGAGGYPGAALARDAVSLLFPLEDEALCHLALDPFSFSARDGQ